MNIKTTLKNLNDPAKMRKLNIAATAVVFALQARRYYRHRTVWNLLPLVRLGITGVEAVFKPGKGKPELAENHGVDQADYDEYAYEHTADE